MGQKENKIKYIRIEQSDGTYSARFPLTIDAENVIMADTSTLEQAVAALKQILKGPKIAFLEQDMNDTNYIYIYLGDEQNFIHGNWYFWDGIDWISGGVYNAVALETDKTLTQENMAADAKAVSNAIESVSLSFVDLVNNGNVVIEGGN